MDSSPNCLTHGASLPALRARELRYYWSIYYKTVPNIVVDSSSTPLLTQDKASSLPGQVCPFHPLSTLELVERAKGFCCVHCPEKICFMFAPASG